MKSNFGFSLPTLTPRQGMLSQLMIVLHQCLPLRIGFSHNINQNGTGPAVHSIKGLLENIRT